MLERFINAWNKGFNNISNIWNGGFQNKIVLIKMFKDRAISWVSILSYIQTTLIYFQVFGFNLMSVILMAILGVIVFFVTILDFVLIMAQELSFQFRINEEFQDVKDSVKKVEGEKK